MVNTCRGSVTEYDCVYEIPIVCVIAQIVFLLEREHTQKHTQSQQKPLPNTLPTHRLVDCVGKIVGHQEMI